MTARYGWIEKYRCLLCKGVDDAPSVINRLMVYRNFQFQSPSVVSDIYDFCQFVGSLLAQRDSRRIVPFALVTVVSVGGVGNDSQHIELGSQSQSVGMIQVVMGMLVEGVEII